MARSQAHSNDRPNPATAPWTLATTGCGMRCSCSIAACSRSIMRMKRLRRSAGALFDVQRTARGIRFRGESSLERACRLQLFDRVGDLGALISGEARDRAGEVRVGDRMRRARRHRQEPARELVHALRAALELADTAFDAEFYRLVIAGFEMQARHEFGRSPIAAPERIRAEHVERGADGPPAALAEHEHDMI